MSLETGMTFDRYRIEGLLGEGGMGKVYRAYDGRLERFVALKIVGGGADGDSEASDAPERRLLREARAAAAIDHPNAVAIFDVGEVSGKTYIAMELIEGRPLSAYVGDASVALGTRLRWLAEIARALDAAHQRGLVHRDVKPTNVMVRRDGRVKVLDFGIARRLRGDPSAHMLATTPARDGGDLALARTIPLPPEAVAATLLATLTKEGAIVGTPLYMAPEQMRGEAVDARADQFSWGVLAYELLAGCHPWGPRATLIALGARAGDQPGRGADDPPRAREDAGAALRVDGPHRLPARARVVRRTGSR